MAYNFRELRRDAKKIDCVTYLRLTSRMNGYNMLDMEADKRNRLIEYYDIFPDLEIIDDQNN